MAQEFPQDEPINPFTELRISKGYSTSDKLANRLKINHNSIDQLEAGMYPNPPPIILRGLEIGIGTEEEHDLIKRYRTYQTKKRKWNSPFNRFNPRAKLITNPIFRTDVNPLQDWREQSNLQKYTVCAMYCIHLPTYNRAETRAVELSEIPSQIITAFTQAGYDGLLDIVGQLIEVFAVHKQFETNRIRQLNKLPPLEPLERAK